MSGLIPSVAVPVRKNTPPRGSAAYRSTVQTPIFLFNSFPMYSDSCAELHNDLKSPTLARKAMRRGTPDTAIIKHTTPTMPEGRKSPTTGMDCFQSRTRERTSCTKTTIPAMQNAGIQNSAVKKARSKSLDARLGRRLSAIRPTPRIAEVPSSMYEKRFISRRT